MNSFESCSLNGDSEDCTAVTQYPETNQKLNQIQDKMRKPKNAIPNKAAVAEYLKRYMDLATPPGPWLRCRHILVRYGPRKHALTKHVNRSESQARNMIENARRLILDGRVSFAAVARAISECCSARQGGDIGLFKEMQVRVDFRQQVLALNINEMSPVFATTEEFQLVLRTHPTDDDVAASERAKCRRQRKIFTAISKGSFNGGRKLHGRALGRRVSNQKVPEVQGSEHDDVYTSTDCLSSQSSAMLQPALEEDHLDALRMVQFLAKQHGGDDAEDNLEYQQQQRWIEENLCEQIENIQLVESGGTRVKRVSRDANGEIVVSFQNMIITKKPKK